MLKSIVFYGLKIARAAHNPQLSPNSPASRGGENNDYDK